MASQSDASTEKSVSMQKSRPLFLSFDLNVNGIQFSSTQEMLGHFGHNVGNLAFVYAMSQQVIGDKAYYANIKKSMANIASEYDVLVFPAANNIGEKSDMGWLADIIEKTNLPILVVGLGVQAYFGKDDFALTPGTRRFFDVVRERNIKLGVRGKYTQDFLARHGVETAYVTGCPSNFINPNPHLGAAVLEKRYAELATGISSVALNLEYFRLESEKVQVLTKWVNEFSGALILQSDESVFSLLRNDYAEDLKKAAWIGQYFLGNQNVEDLKRWLVRYGRIYCHVPSWMDYLRGLSLSVGSRFHGNMLAIQAGTPAVVFPHDTRTQEMCETMLLPHFAWEKIVPGTGVQDVLKEVHFDGAAFDKNRAHLARVYRELVRNVGLDVIPSVQAIGAAA
jgi:polysaccharide pyruvyl transferase WcaK-like protein